MLIINGIKVVSLNTDGCLSYVRYDQKELYEKLSKEWEVLTKHTLEETLYKSFIQTSVNDYIAITVDGKIKKKGDFQTEFEVHKNKSKRVVALALEQYFVKGIKPEDFIVNHKNIYDFCLTVKGKSDSKFYLLNQKTNDKRYLQKTNRFYIAHTRDILVKELTANEKKTPTYQINIFGEVDSGERETRVEVGYNVMLFNKYEDKANYNLNYQYYIDKTYQIINKIIKINE